MRTRRKRKTYDKGREHVHTRRIADIGADEDGDNQRNGREGVDCGGLDDGLNDTAVACEVEHRARNAGPMGLYEGPMGVEKAEHYHHCGIRQRQRQS